MSNDLKIKTAAGKAPLNLVPLRVLKGPARVFAYGGKKYKVGNYLQATMEDGAGGRYIGAELRHMADMQGLDGQFTPESLAVLDPESGLPHIDHMLCGLIMLRAIMIKDGVLAEDPGEGLEPPSVAAKSIEQVLVDHRVKQGNYDVVPFENDYLRTIGVIEPPTFKGREVDDWFDDVPRTTGEV